MLYVCVCGGWKNVAQGEMKMEEEDCWMVILKGRCLLVKDVLMDQKTRKSILHEAAAAAIYMARRHVHQNRILRVLRIGSFGKCQQQVVAHPVQPQMRS